MERLLHWNFQVGKMNLLSLEIPRADKNLDLKFSYASSFLHLMIAIENFLIKSISDSEVGNRMF